MDAKKRFRRKLVGIVVSDKTDKTIVVKVVRRVRHGAYSKYMHKTKKYHAHDPENSAKIGDEVTIIESRPFSKLKKWHIVSK